LFRASIPEFCSSIRLEPNSDSAVIPRPTARSDTAAITSRRRFSRTQRGTTSPQNGSSA
jgi:hypothetical protein